MVVQISLKILGDCEERGVDSEEEVINSVVEEEAKTPLSYYNKMVIRLPLSCRVRVEKD